MTKVLASSVFCAISDQATAARAVSRSLSPPPLTDSLTIATQISSWIQDYGLTQGLAKGKTFLQDLCDDLDLTIGLNHLRSHLLDLLSAFHDRPLEEIRQVTSEDALRDIFAHTTLRIDQLTYVDNRPTVSLTLAYKNATKSDSMTLCPSRLLV